jgi:hypothetical protein
VYPRYSFTRYTLLLFFHLKLQEKAAAPPLKEELLSLYDLQYVVFIVRVQKFLLIRLQALIKAMLPHLLNYYLLEDNVPSLNL